MPDNKPALCFIGFGEAGQAIAAGLRDEGVVRIAAWDILFPEARAKSSSARPTRSACAAPPPLPMRCAMPT